MKKWTYLAVAGMLLGSAPVFTGCVDTDEPWGVEQLRGAKAELLKAKAAVEQANAEYRQAEIQWLAAKTAQEQADAKYKEYAAEAQRIANEIQEARNEAEKAKLEAEKQYYLNLMEEQMVLHETAMINYQKALEQAKRQYEVYMKQIEIAEALGSDEEKVTLQMLKDKVKNTYFALYGDGTGTNGLAKELRDAQEYLYNAQMNKLAGYDSGSEDFPTTDPDIWIPTLENEVAKAQADVAAAQEMLDDLEEFKAKPVEDTDWRAELDKLQEEIDALETKEDEISLQITEGKTAPEYLEKYQAVNGVTDENNNLVAGGEGTKHILNNANQALLKKQQEEKLSIADYKPETPITDEMLKAIKAKTPSVTDASWFSYSNQPQYTWAKSTATNPSFANEYPQEIKDLIENKYEAWLEAIELATPKTANEIAQAQAALADAKKDEADQKKKYEDAVKEWEKILKIVQNAEDYDVETTEFEKATKAYNDAYDALDKAINDWNTQVAAAYQDAYDEELEKQTASVRTDVLTLLDGGSITGDTYGTRPVAGFQAATALAQWNAFGVNNLQTEANFTKVVNDNCGTASSTAAEKAQIQTAVWAQINNFVTLTTQNTNWTGTQAAITAGKTAATTNFDKDGKLAKAISDSEKAVNDKYTALDKAIAAFKTLASETYAQKLTEAAAKLLAKDMLAGVVKDNKATVGAWQTSKNNEQGYKVYTIGNTKIEDKEIADATATVFDSNKGATALGKASDATFGRDANGSPWYVQPSREEWEASANSNPNSAAGLYYAAVEVREGHEAIISANDDLNKLGEEIETALADFKEQLAADYAEAFKDEQAAWDDAKAKDDAARKALAEADAQFNDLYVEQNEVRAQINAKKYLSSTLQQLIWENLGIEWPSGSTGGNTGTTYNPETFADLLDEAIELAKDDLAEAQQELKEAELELKKAQDGEYDEVAYAEYKLAIVQARYDEAVEAYKKAQDDLAKGLEIMAATSEEQPAE